MTAWQIAHVLLRDHPWYGGSSLLPLDGRRGDRRPMRDWLSDLAVTWSRLAEPGGPVGRIDGRRALLSLAALEPVLGALLEGSGVASRLRADVAEALGEELGGDGAGGTAGTASAPDGSHDRRTDGGTPAGSVEDATEWQSDRPETDRDLLGRRPLPPSSPAGCGGSTPTVRSAARSLSTSTDPGDPARARSSTTCGTISGRIGGWWSI